MTGKANCLSVRMPLYGTYNDQLIGSVPAAANPALRNWYLSHALELLFYGEEIRVRNAGWRANPHLECRTAEIPESELPEAVCRLLDGGWYAALSELPFVAGVHAGRAGLITGMRKEDRIFRILSCDACGVRRQTVLPWRAFCGGGVRTLRGIRAKQGSVPFDRDAARQHLKAWLLSAQREEIGEWLEKSIYNYNTGSLGSRHFRNLRTLAEQRFAVAQAIGLLDRRETGMGRLAGRYLRQVAVPTGTAAGLSKGFFGLTRLRQSWEEEAEILSELLSDQAEAGDE